MRLVLGSVLRFILESVAWIALVAVVAVALAALVRWLGRQAAPGLARTTAFAMAGAVLAASIIHRLDGPFGLLLSVGRRDLPLMWAGIGAVTGPAAAIAVGLRAGRAG